MAGQVTRHVYGEDTFQFGDLRLPDGNGPHPVLILIHGGFWRARYALDLMDEMAEFFTRQGYLTWNIEYRRVGHAGGGWPGTVQDVAMAIDYLSILAGEVSIDIGRVGVIGHSAGGHLALWQAAREQLALQPGLNLVKPVVRPTAIISLAGVSNLRHMHEVRSEDSPVQAFLGGTPNELSDVYRLASPWELLPLGVPQLLVHGTEDDSVPYEQSLHYFEVAEAMQDSVELLTLPGVDHFAIIQPTSDVWETIAQRVQEFMLTQHRPD